MGPIAAAVCPASFLQFDANNERWSEAPFPAIDGGTGVVLVEVYVVP